MSLRIGIDISQTAYPGTGVARYTRNLVEHLVKVDDQNHYLLFFSSLRAKLPVLFKRLAERENVAVRRFFLPPTLLEFFWNRLHIFPIERFIGPVEVFISSDWTQPPAQQAKLVTVIHDLIPWRFPETLVDKIVRVHKQRLKRVKQECELIICDSRQTKEDARQILGLDDQRLVVIYPGVD